MGSEYNEISQYTASVYNFKKNVWGWGWGAAVPGSLHYQERKSPFCSSPFLHLNKESLHNYWDWTKCGPTSGPNLTPPPLTY